jgi:class 3 adenylate cyclase/tetratricopeptide (TPR) repeat protein
MADAVELATIWLVDLVGSTRLAASVGPVRADSLREEYFALLRDAIDAFGGREFKNTGDGLFVAFSSASAAVSCAVLTQQLFERRYRGAEQALHVRVGLGTGESTVRDGDYFGMPSIEAARLCDKAPVDGILVSSATKMLAGRVGGARFESAGEMELKGIPEPMAAFAVAWEPLADESGVQVGAWPVPPPLRSVPRAPYVGRVEERALMDRARAQARAGARRVVLLAGEPGIGKTRLASHAGLRAHAEGFVVSWGACSEDVAAPYEPWIEVCSQLVEHAPDDVLAGYVAAHGGDIARLARNLAGRAPDAPPPQSSDPDTERFLLFRAVDELLLAVGRSQPLCVVLDDFHWADGQSVALLKHVARTVEQGALLVIVTYRDSDLTKDHPLTGVLADLWRSECTERIRLSGLGSDEVAELVAAAAGHELDADGLTLAGGLSTETGGNPFFVGEILRNLIESGAITFDETARRWSVDEVAMSNLPESVREVVEHRIDRLGDHGREVLTVAAVIGRSFDVELLAQLVEMSEARLLDQLEAAVQASLLRESTASVGRFDFEHALINHTLYQGLGRTRRARFHQRVAKAIEQLYGTDSDEHLGELALHWRLATPDGRLKAAGYSLRAGQRVLDSLAPSEAARLFGDALDMLGPAATAVRCEALIGLGEAQRQTGVSAYRETLLEAAGIASELGDADLAARAALANNRGFVSRTGLVDAERVGAIERAIELDDPPQPARHALLLSLLAKELAFEPDRTRRRALGDEAIALARQASDPRTLATALESSCYSIWAPDTLATRSERARELSALVAQVGDLQVEFLARVRELSVAIELGDFGWADEALERAEAIAEQTRQPTQRWNASFLAASVLCMRGELEASERLAEQAFQLGQEAGHSDAATFYGGTIVQVRLVQGRGAEVIALIEGMVTENPGVPVWEAALAYTCCLIDRRPEAAEILGRAAAQHFEHLPYDQFRLVGLGLYADAAAQTRSVEAAAMLYELIEPHADQFIWAGAVSYGHARMYTAMLAAMLGRHEHADADFAFACDFHHRHGVRAWEARSELGWAEALAERGELDRAREHASRALELSRDYGYGAFEPRAAAIVASGAAIHP